MNVHVAIVQAMDEIGISKPPQVVEFCKLVEEKLQADNSKSMPCHNKTCDACKDGECRFADHLCSIRK